MLDQQIIKESVQRILQDLGAPVMDYSPHNANIERALIIEVAIARLFLLLKRMEVGL